MLSAHLGRQRESVTSTRHQSASLPAPSGLMSRRRQGGSRGQPHTAKLDSHLSTIQPWHVFAVSAILFLGSVYAYGVTSLDVVIETTDGVVLNLPLDGAGYLVAAAFAMWGMWISRDCWRLSRPIPSAHITPVPTYDSVTGLPTERLFSALTGQAIARSEHLGRFVAVLLVELEHFLPESGSDASLNTTMISRVQSARIKSALRSTDTVARIADGSFAVLIDSVAAVPDVVRIAEKIQSTLSLPMMIDGHELFLSSHIGLALYPEDGSDGSSLLTAASKAMSNARATGQSIGGLHQDINRALIIDPQTASISIAHSRPPR